MSVQPIWEGVYASFAEAGGRSTAFDSDVWLNKLVARAQAGYSRLRSMEKLSDAAKTRDYVLPVVAALCARDGRALRILDFGGGIADGYWNVAAFLPQRTKIDFHVIETSAVCAVAKRTLPAGLQISFHPDMNGLDGQFDIIHAGSAAHYIEDWRGLIHRFGELATDYLVFAELPAGNIPSFVTVQNYYGHRIPVHFWNLQDFIDVVETIGFKLMYKAAIVRDFQDGQEPLPTANLPAGHRIDALAQLIFRRAIRKRTRKLDRLSNHVG